MARKPTQLPECPACAHPRTRALLPVPVAGTDPLWIHACAECTHRFVPTTPAQQARIDTTYGEGYVGHRDDPFFTAAIAREVERVLVPRIPPPARVLDVGCGNGEFLLAATRRGYHAEGIDVSEAGVKRCRARGAIAHVDDFLTAEYAEPFHVITFWDVVEHLRHPDEFLRRARELLAPGGAVLVKTPSTRPRIYPLLRLYPRLANVALEMPGHVQFFTRHSFGMLLARCGLGRVEWLPPVSLHSWPHTGGLKRRLARLAGKAAQRYSGVRNLYIWACPDAPAEPRAEAASAATGSHRFPDRHLPEPHPFREAFDG